MHGGPNNAAAATSHVRAPSTHVMGLKELAATILPEISRRVAVSTRAASSGREEVSGNAFRRRTLCDSGRPSYSPIVEEDTTAAPVDCKIY